MPSLESRWRCVNAVNEGPAFLTSQTRIADRRMEQICTAGWWVQHRRAVGEDQSTLEIPSISLQLLYQAFPLLLPYQSKVHAKVG